MSTTFLKIIIKLKICDFGDLSAFYSFMVNCTINQLHTPKTSNKQ